jgi:hypothetical protein
VALRTHQRYGTRHVRSLEQDATRLRGEQLLHLVLVRVRARVRVRVEVRVRVRVGVRPRVRAGVRVGLGFCISSCISIMVPAARAAIAALASASFRVATSRCASVSMKMSAT